jgi:hypothetical protein
MCEGTPPVAADADLARPGDARRLAPGAGCGVRVRVAPGQE